jgi:hypothetical protein
MGNTPGNGRGFRFLQVGGGDGAAILGMKKGEARREGGKKDREPNAGATAIGRCIHV